MIQICCSQIYDELREVNRPCDHKTKRGCASLVQSPAITEKVQDNRPECSAIKQEMQPKQILKGGCLPLLGCSKFRKGCLFGVSR